MALQEEQCEIDGDRQVTSQPIADVPARPGACTRIVPVVLAGGSGTRLWPVSGEHDPQQLIDVFGSDSLLQATVRRMNDFPAGWQVSESPIVVCGIEHQFTIAEQLRASGVDARFIVEPVRRDTAPALTLAASLACAAGDDAILVVMPSDQLITDTPALQRAIELAARHAERGAIATLGVPPTRAETGFGNIRIGAPIGDGAYRIERFVEKPAADLAAEYLSAGSYWWNSVNRPQGSTENEKAHCIRYAGIARRTSRVGSNPSIHCRASLRTASRRSAFATRRDDSAFRECPCRLRHRLGPCAAR
jgi:mannose-1-phosphate guanylyltransferase / mannose-6-phosphate isomerase